MTVTTPESAQISQPHIIAANTNATIASAMDKTIQATPPNTYTLAMFDICTPAFSHLPALPSFRQARLILQPISKPAVNDWPLVASGTEIEKVRPFCL
jgi:hypothetical protein